MDALWHSYLVEDFTVGTFHPTVLSQNCVCSFHALGNAILNESTTHIRGWRSDMLVSHTSYRYHPELDASWYKYASICSFITFGMILSWILSKV